jgi:hypothetical protein
MPFLYTVLLLLLVVAKFLINRRVAWLEKKYVRIAARAAALLHQPGFKEGNTSRSDPYLTAKRQYVLGMVGQKRDHLEAKHDAWLAFAEKFGRFIGGVHRWQGKVLPYTFGVVDVMLVLTVIDYLGFSDSISGRRLVDVIISFFTNHWSC